MSALRISRPGIGTTLIDLGPDVGRRSFTRGAVYGGVMVVGGHRQRTVDQARAAAVIQAQKERTVKVNPERPKCGYLMPVLGERCARRPGHAPDHKSAAGMEAIAKRRWAR